VFELRPYQTEALNLIRGEYAKKNKKVLLHLATGAGKTVIFCQILKGSYTKGKKAIMVVRGRKLVDQASQRLDREGVPHGVMMAGHKKYDPTQSIQVCSIDTLISRDLRPEADLIVVDEAHLAISGGYKRFIELYPEAYILAVTATPYVDQSLRHLADVVVSPISVKELIDQKYLAPPKYFTHSVPDLKGVKTSNSKDGRDYVQRQLEAVMDVPKIMGDIATTWMEKAQGRPTLAFCVSVSHSQSLCSHLQKLGIRAAHVDASSSDKERQAYISMLENGELDILCNCGILCVGVDIPAVSAIILARPTKSKNLHIQQMGRGTRNLAGKNDFLVLDHAGNVLKHKFLTTEHEIDLDEKAKAKKVSVDFVKQCSVCFGVFESNETECPYCGNTEQTKIRSIKTVDGELKEIKPEDLDPVAQFITRMKAIQKERGYKKGWVYFKLVEKFGEETANKYMPKRFVPSWISGRA